MLCPNCSGARSRQGSARWQFAIARGAMLDGTVWQLIGIPALPKRVVRRMAKQSWRPIWLTTDDAAPDGALPFPD